MAITSEMLYDPLRDMYFDNRQCKLEHEELTKYAHIQRQMMGNAGMGTLNGPSTYALQGMQQTVQPAPIPPIRETKLLLLLED